MRLILRVLVICCFCFPVCFAAQNEVKSFVYQWFSQFDKNDDVNNFLKYLPQKEFLIKFPNTEIRSHEEFKKWYSGILKAFKTANHEIEYVTVEKNADSKYLVDLIVVWSAEGFDTKKIKLRVHQKWVVSENQSSKFLIDSYIVDFVFNKVAAKIKNKEPVYGGFITIPNSKIIENLTMSGKLNFVWLEAEHTEFGPKEVQQLAITAENQRIIPIVRVPDNDPNLIKKYIGTGVGGIVVPNVKNAEDAQKAVAAIKYAPLGQRSVGVERATGYLTRLDDYIPTANDNVLVILMLETKEAVRNIDSIMTVKGVDLVHVGPYDLSMSMGVKRDSKELSDAILKVENAAKKHNIPLGSYAPDLKTAIEKAKRGYYLFTIPGDMEILQKGIATFFNK